MEINEEDAPFTIQNTQRSNIKTNFQVIRNLLCLSVSFSLVIGEFVSLQSLQSSIHAEHGLGLSLLAILYGTAVLGLIAASSIVKRLTAKRTILLGFLIHTSFVLTQFYPTVWLILSEGALIGFTSGFIWVAQFSYISSLANNAVRLQPKSEDALSKKLQKFNGTFFAIYSLSGLMAIISSITLTREKENSSADSRDWNFSTTAMTKYEPSTYVNILSFDNKTESDLKSENKCGAFYCPSKSNEGETSLLTPTKSSLQIFLVICLSINILAIIIFSIGADNIKEINKETNKKKSDRLLSNLYKLCKSLFNFKFLLLVWPGIFKGVLQGLVFGTFPLIFGSCVFGVESVGYLQTGLKMCSCIATFIVSRTARYVHRSVPLIASSVILIGTILGWLLWVPRNDQLFIAMAIGGGLSVNIDVPWSQIQALLPIIFQEDKEMAYTFYTICSFLALAATCQYSRIICAQFLMYILLSAWTLAAISYGVLEVKYARTVQEI